MDRETKKKYNCSKSYWIRNSILNIVCEVCGIELEDIKGNSRKHILVAARQIYCVLVYKFMCKNYDDKKFVDFIAKKINKSRCIFYYSQKILSLRLYFDNIKINGKTFLQCHEDAKFKIMYFLNETKQK